MIHPAPRFVILGIVAALLLAPTLGAAGPGKPSCNPDTAFESDEVRIAFKGHKGMVQVFAKNAEGGNDGMYQYKTNAIREIATGNGNETLASMDLGRAYPQESNCTITETEDFLDITFTVPATVRATDGGDLGEASATFAYHFNKTANGAKFDLFVSGWPWQSDASELAFDFDVDAGAWTIESAENGLGFRGNPTSGDGEEDTPESKGYIEWAANATATYADGHEETAVVDSTVDNSGSHASVSLRFTAAQAGYTDLAYDPWAGVGDYVIIGNVLIGDRALLGLVDAALDFVRIALP